MYRIGVVGSGPAAFYTVQKLLKSAANINVDMFEKLPAPFGLVRYGVAPDHPEVKNVINSFTQVCKNPRFRYFGNVAVGKDLRIRQMREIYDSVLLAYGAAVDRKLNIPGEDLNNIYSANDIVGWYNGLPEKEEFTPDLSGEQAIIIGHGNVTLDIARILLSPVDLLKKTDMSDRVLSQLASSRIRNITLVGRRGPLQVSFTIKEFRELLRIPNAFGSISFPPGIKLDQEFIDSLPRPRRRLTSLMVDAASSSNSSHRLTHDDRSWNLQFQRAPVRFHGEGDVVRAVEVEYTSLGGPGMASAVGTGCLETMPCDMVVRSIGYRSVRIDNELPFDEESGTVPSVAGRVPDNGFHGDRLCPMYCVGWIKRGPVGVILDTIADAQETAGVMLEDHSNHRCQGRRPGAELDVADILQSTGVKFLSFSNWEAIDEIEIQLGLKKGKPREKLTSLHELMLAATRNTDTWRLFSFFWVNL